MQMKHNCLRFVAAAEAICGLELWSFVALGSFLGHLGELFGSSWGTLTACGAVLGWSWGGLRRLKAKMLISKWFYNGLAAQLPFLRDIT